MSGRPVRRWRAGGTAQRSSPPRRVKSAETPISPIRPMRTPVPSTPSQRLGHDLVGDGVGGEVATSGGCELSR